MVRMKRQRSVLLLFVIVFLIASCIATIQPTKALADSWTRKASMHVARSNLGVAVANGKIYAIGGNKENGYIPNSAGNNYKALGWIADENEEYDPATDTWASKKSMPTPRLDFAIASYKNKIYCMGGITNVDPLNFTPVNEVYDPVTNTWEIKAPMPNATAARASIVGGKIYLIGGGSNETLNQMYDPETDSWSMKNSMPIEPIFSGANTVSPIGGLVSAVVDNKIYVMSISFSRAINFVYDSANDSWSSVAMSSSPFNILNGRGGQLWWSQAVAATTGAMASKLIYVFFANYPYAKVLPNLIYYFSAKSWGTGADVPTYRVNFGIAVLNDTFYAIGGRTYNYPFPDDNYFTVAESAANEQYLPVGYGTPDPTYQTPTPEPTPSPLVTASLSESASALNYGNKINFTVSVNGGMPPYTYSWYVDGQSLENSSSPYFSTNSQAVGSHHVYVQVTDANNNSATTLTVEFNVLPITSPSSSSSPTQQPTPTPKGPPPTPPPPVGDGFIALYRALIAGVIAVAIVLGLAVYFTKYRKKKAGS